MTAETVIAANSPNALGLADLEAFDAQPRGRGRERVFRCPVCQSDERALHLNTETGAWNCKRASCGAKGKIKDFWEDRPALGRRELTRQRQLQAFKIAPAAPDVQSVEVNGADWRRHLRGLQPLAGTPGAAYLRGCGVPLDLAHRCGVRFAPSWYGRAAVMFPIRDRAGQLVAAQGRYMDGQGDPKARTGGPKSGGVFAASSQLGQPGAPRIYGPFDEAAPAIIITEAPIDALSLAACGFPALALCGTSGPAWLNRACGLKRVLLAFDADDNHAGDGAAAALLATLTPYTARCERLRPEGGKDWNERLQAVGAPALADWLAVRGLLDAAARLQIEALPNADIFDD